MGGRGARVQAVAALMVACASSMSGCSNPLPTPSCTDGLRDGDETDVDCGGSCAACAAGKACFHAADCQGSSCVNNVCAGGPSDGGSPRDLNLGCVNNQQCDGLPHASAICGPDDRCTITACDPGFADCDKQALDGCEVSLQTDVANCGTCGKACGTVLNGTAACKAGQCSIGGCNSGFANCDGLFASGCKVATSADVANCGACAHVCTAPNGTPSCTSGACGIASCQSGFADCDMNAQNGCETSLTSDPMHCGGCNNVCSALPNATATCVNSACGVGACAMGYAHCTTNPNMGCETNVGTDPMNCGGCGRVCAPVNNGVAGCKMAACGVGSCNAPWGDCDGNPMNGCEANLSTDIANCGACGAACTFANATGSCANGQCSLLACNMGFADCDMNPANGCEANLQGDPLNCGACNAPCMGNTPYCVNGQCSSDDFPPVYLLYYWDSEQ